MKNILKMLVFVMLLGGIFSCDAKPIHASTSKSKAKVELFYFHFTRRCVTCNAVEEVTRKSLDALFLNQLKDGTISFKSINLDESTGKAVGEKLGVSGQTLLLVGAGKSIDLTSEAFLTAKNNPEKLKAILKSNIEPIIK